MYAVISKDASAVRSLIDQGADMNIQSRCQDGPLSTDGDTALHIAARGGLVEIVKILLEPKNKIEVNIQNGHGDTALHLAAYYEHLGVIQLLFEIGPNNIKADLKNRDGDTFLSIAEKKGIQIKADWVKVIPD